MKKRDLCAVCGGRVVRRSINHDQHWGDQIVMFEAVPARVCVSCGEVWFHSKVIKAMEKILKRQRKPKKKIMIPVWSLAGLKAA